MSVVDITGEIIMTAILKRASQTPPKVDSSTGNMVLFHSRPAKLASIQRALR